MAWTMDWHDLTSLANDNLVYTETKRGSIPANEREFTFRMTSPSAIKFSVPLAHPMGQQIASAPYGFGVVSLYQDGVLRMNAESTSIVINNEGPAATVAVNAVEPLRSRLALMPGGVDQSVLAGTAPIAPYVFPITPGQAGARLLAERQMSFQLAGMPMATPGTTASISPSSWDVDVTLLDLMDSLANRASGFDYWLEPVPLEWRMGLSILAALMGPICGKLHIANIRGTSVPTARIEFGTGRLNAKKYQLSNISADQLVTGAYVLSQAKPADPPAVAGAVSNRLEAFGARALTTMSDLEDLALRQQLADEIIARRSVPRRIASITPMPATEGANVPRPFFDYGLGDIIPIKVVDEGVTLVDGDVRVYGIIVTPDENDMENVELELTPDTA